MKYDVTKRSANDRWGSSNKSLLPLPSPIPPPMPRSSSKTTVDGDDSARDSEFKPPIPDASAILLLAVTAFPSRPVVEALEFVVPPVVAPVVGVPVVATELPAVASVVFGDVTFVMKSNADDSPKYSPGKAEWLLLGRSLGGLLSDGRGRLPGAVECSLSNMLRSWWCSGLPSAVDIGEEGFGYWCCRGPSLWFRSEDSRGGANGDSFE